MFASLPSPIPAYSDENPRCQLCEEPIDWDSTSDSAGEFSLPDNSDSVVAHVQCGLDAGLEIA